MWSPAIRAAAMWRSSPINKRGGRREAELVQIKNTRSVQRARREKNQVPVVALVGYTNSGKSALMNRILAKTEKNEEERKVVFEKNMLFATLDVQQRSVVKTSAER